LEILEKIAANSKLNIAMGERVQGDRGLTDRIVNVL
jgi:hypothetical protein